MKRTAVLLPIALAVILLSIIGLVFANPIAASMVTVESPVNNQVYPTNTVELNATEFPGFNFALKYYVLDGLPPVSTNGTAELSNLSPGSHTLKLYGTLTITHGYTNTTYEQNDLLVSVVYFSVIYSSKFVLFTVTLISISLVTCFVLYEKHREIKKAMKGQKNELFIIGLLFFVFSILPLSVSAWQISKNYLFPSWPRELLGAPFFSFIISFLMLSFGLFLMWFEAHKKARVIISGKTGS
jgi:hypothetical protein